MEWQEVQRRIAGGQGPHTAFEPGSGDLSAVGRAACAFANTRGGLVVLGVNDAGTTVGATAEREDLRVRLTSLLRSACSAPVEFRLRSHRDVGGRIDWIEVPRQASFEPFRFQEQVWVRDHRGTVEPSPAELQDLYRSFGYVLSEGCSIGAAPVEEIDLAAFRSYLRALDLETANEPSPPTQRDDLRGRGLVTEIGGDLHPTLYGLMAFGKQPQGTPQTASFCIECVAYDGVDRAANVAQVGEARGRLDEQVRWALGWARSLGRLEPDRGLFREDIPLVPERVLREALANAVVHRDYAITGSKVLFEVFSDRIDVTSPGTLPNPVTPESVRAGGRPRSRNERMANFMRVKGVTEKRGRGWPVMRRAMREFNGTGPELVQDMDGRFVRVTLRLDGSRAGADERLRDADFLRVPEEAGRV